MHYGFVLTVKAVIQLLSVYFLNIRVSQLTKRIQDLQRDGDIARLRMFRTLLPYGLSKYFL